MNVSLYQAASAMNANVRWQDMITQNLAAGSIPGYKKKEVSFEAVQAGLARSSPTQPTTPIVMPRTVGATNFLQGEVNPTDNKTDLALEGDGFFEVQLPQGGHAYTRNGQFQLNAQGQLVTSQGYLLMGDGGPLQLDPRNSAPLSIAPTGEVSQGADVISKVKVVGFNDPQLLTALGGGFYQSQNPGLIAGPANGTLIRQGFLESSNVTSTVEMASLINSMRLFEANQKVMSLQDERMGRAISDLGNPS